MDSKKGDAEGHATKTLGPVSDLERHLPSDWWLGLFNSLYLKTDGDVVENDENTVAEINAVVDLTGINRDDYILDLCCGQGRHSLELARRGFRNITGLDRSRYLIRLARGRAKQEGLNVTFRERDARKIRPNGDPYACVLLLGNSFGYFDREDDDLLLLKRIREVLSHRGMLLMDIADGEHLRNSFDSRSWEWIDQSYFVCRERSLSSDERRLISREVVVHADEGVIADQFYGERLYSKESLQALLEKAGFESVQFHESLVSKSTRNQDLGMMANRLVCTSVVHKPTLASREREPLYAETTVLLGDPSLPDTVKREGRFSDEDMATISKMRDALGQLSGVKFTFIDNHVSLINALLSKRPKFVLNLCDEGFNNEATQELHVPALLEMLGIPYTGAGPQCLGMCYNKSLVAALADSLDIPVPLETYFDPDDQAANLPSVFPALVKPNFGDNSIGISKEAVVHDSAELLEYLSKLWEKMPNVPVLIQEFLSGPEYSVGIIGNPGLSMEVLPPLEVDYSGLTVGLPRILGYESKWDPASPYWTQIKYKEAEIDEETRRKLIDYSSILFERLGCRDYARFDFRADADGEVKLLEVNPNPGWCWDGKFNMMCSYAGLGYSEMLLRILDAAEERMKSPEGAQGANGNGNGHGNGGHGNGGGCLHR